MDKDNDFYLLIGDENDDKESKWFINDLDLEKGFMDLDNSYEKDIDQLKMISESTKDILKDLEDEQKIPDKESNNVFEYDNPENKYIENMKNLERINLLKEKSKREKLSISTIKNNIESIYNELMKEKNKNNLRKRKKKTVKNSKKW